ncbi:hypothetical protein SLA2020_483910 [Shorea laevis]
MGFFGRAKPLLRSSVMSRSPSTSRVLTRTLIRDSSPRLSQINWSFSASAANGAKFSGFSLHSPVYPNRYQYDLFLNVTKRFYHADTHNFRQYGGLFQNRHDVFVGLRLVLASGEFPIALYFPVQLMVIVSGLLMAFSLCNFSVEILVYALLASGVHWTALYFASLEMVPYTNRTRFMPPSKLAERLLAVGDVLFNHIKEEINCETLPTTHPSSVRVTLICQNIVEAFQRGIEHEQVQADLKSASIESLCGEGKDEGKWCPEDGIFDCKGKSAEATRALPKLDGFNCEILVQENDQIGATSWPGGKIIVFSGTLEEFPSDAEIATIIAHEIGHAVARHFAERITRDLMVLPLEIMTFGLTRNITTSILRRPFNHRTEFEADYIGLLLMASAGYDPQVAPAVYEKMSKIGGDSESDVSHPSTTKRAQMLTQAKVMDKALRIYRERKNRTTA